jgi:hypothetical protein
MSGFDKILGDATMGGIGSAIGGGILGGMVIGAAQSGCDFTGVGTAVRYGLGGGMDTFNFKDGSKAYHFSDGDQILTDKNGKYVASFYSHSMP